MHVMLLLIAGLFHTTFADGAGRRLDITRESLLLYLDKLSDSFDAAGRHNRSERNRLTAECETREFHYTVYYRMVYFRVCGESRALEIENGAVFRRNSSREDFARFCGLVGDNKASSAAIQTYAERYEIYGSGIESDQRWLAQQSCKYIGDYYARKDELNVNASETGVRRYPNYTEWFISSVPFALPVACGFTEEKFRSSTDGIATTDCLAPSLKWALYMTLLVDGFIALMVATTNLIILAIFWGTPVMRTAHGNYRASLAAADLLISMVICGAMNTTHTIYFEPRKFTGENDKPTILDYHQQHYIDGFGVLTVVSLAASVFTLVAISVDRFLAIFRPILYKIHTKRIKKLSIAVVISLWVLGVLLAIFPLFLNEMSYTVTALGVIIAVEFYVAYVVCLGISILCVWILNFKMFFTIKQYVKKSLVSKRSSCREDKDDKERSCSPESGTRIETVSGTVHERSSSPTESTSSHSRLDMDLHVSLAGTVIVVVSAFTLAILPSIGVMISGTSLTLEPASRFFNPDAKTTWSSFAYLSSRLLFSNSFFNYIIYSYRNKQFRNATKKLFTISALNSARTEEDSNRSWLKLRSKSLQSNLSNN